MTRTIMQSRLAFELTRLLLLTFCILMLTQRPSYGITLAIDFDGGGGPTQSGFVGLPLPSGTTAAGSSVTVDGVTFTVTSADGSADLGVPDALTRDFIYGEGLWPGLSISVTGLMPGQWMLDVWSSIDLVSGNGGNAYTQLRILSGGSTDLTSDWFIADPTQPHTFQLYGGGANSLALPSDFNLFVDRSNRGSTRVICDSGEFQCVNGEYVVKDPNNACQYCPCPVSGQTLVDLDPCPGTGPATRYQMRLKALMLTSVALDPPEPNPAPEPPTLVLVALGLAMAGFVFVRRRRT